MDCAADKTDEFHAVGAALGGSEYKAAVFQELLDNCVTMFVSVLAPHAGLALPALRHCCIGLAGAGEALSATLVRGAVTREEAVAAFARLIGGVVQQAER